MICKYNKLCIKPTLKYEEKHFYRCEPINFILSIKLTVWNIPLYEFCSKFHPKNDYIHLI